MPHLAREGTRAYGIRIVVLGALMGSVTPIFAQTSPVETIIVTGHRSEDAAVGVAPTAAPLDAIQPTSILSQDYIAKNLPLSGNYDEAIEISPSVFDTAPNGPGLAESQNISIRGFQDGQFNVTFDGIPWGDANDFTHHSTSYFMAHDLGELSVDRGPGTAATIGNATFGGTVSLLSKAPDDDMSITPYASYGSFNTLLYGSEFDSGPIDATDGTRVMFDTELLKSDGYLTNMALTRSNAFFKVVQPLGNNTTLTVAAMYNNLHQDISLGATAAQIATLGPSWGLSADPANQNYFGYNNDRISTDFEYMDLESAFGDGWSTDSKVYTFAYFHHGLNGEDPNGEFPNGTVVNGVTYPNDVPGQSLTNDYRSIGTIERVTKEFSFGDIKMGVWYDRQINTRALYEVDMTRGAELNLDPDTGVPNGIDRQLHQTLTTFQPYLQVDWTPLQDLTVSPGVRYSYFDRNVNADVNVKTGSPQAYDNTFDAILPSIVAHYTIDPDWTAYAQAAEGFLAPNENFFNHSDPNATNVSPEKSWNYQAGTALQLPNLTASADVYYIDFSNFIASEVVGGQTVYFNQGGVTYMGIEGEATYMLGYGFSLYGNGTLNSAKDQTTHQWIANAPETTAALGVIYDHDGLYGSLIGKWIGSRYGDVNQTQGLSPLFTIDGAAAYDLGRFEDALKGVSVKLQVYNLTDVKKIINLAGYTVQDGTPLYWTQPGRSVFASVAVKL
jgi:iron complex outermembrane receptor protein